MSFDDRVRKLEQERMMEKIPIGSGYCSKHQIQYTVSLHGCPLCYAEAHPEETREKHKDTVEAFRKAQFKHRRRT